MSLAERITLWLAQMRASGHAVVVARLVILVAGTVAVVVPGLQSWDQMALVPVIAVPALVATVALPDSMAGMLFLLVVSVGWIMRAPGEVTWGLAVTAIALVVVHLAASFAGQVPSYARVHRDALRRWWLPGAIAVLLVPVVGIAAALVQGADVPGSLLVTVGALLLATAVIWFASGQRLGRDASAELRVERGHEFVRPGRADGIGTGGPDS